ncbi:sigma-70 family RNA polymerase sigma factor [Tenacibaculum finnmarkense]|uniref:RNA polymerase subunit sigma-70 n=2 Tax=Tenacibaculum finnmarkense TaxID=2781243 RepID=A0A2I2MBI9_9FLAO|nr:sigma-70 family RNA polymerase sigma factor [Tenacibaculum finnmarkense]MBE7634174.1 sigma-70 family RNA polymerase sigma factor [Tenacibaculum finnmarkense genomovar ulcerans]MBE7653899.1 sigma-70 family RNA polymerase sigma factor [Tenacibaculum finnmarkense genomovar finnmarkense]MBE7692895.1 sigma-70 family RNA polymerase sigma factor [Tenacibaculum finnmarkense genomovar finnmarkense]MBE7696196.1 sigma-70 family RNA polymerase sigma factor [Tenacibaculum finnmarkense genomovar finnmarke
MKSIDITKLSDEELVSKIVEKNDSHLFAVLYDRYAGVVYNKCYGFSKNKEEAQDLTHDVFIRLFVKLRTFKGRSKFSTWLYSFTYNFCVNYVQRNKEKKKEKVTVVTDQIKEDSNEDEIDDAELFELKADKLAKVLEMIPAPEKMILLMKYQDDMSIKEISEALSLGDSAVKMRLKRAKEKVIRVYNTL